MTYSRRRRASLSDIFEKVEWLIWSASLSDIFERVEWLIRSASLSDIFKRVEWLIRGASLNDIFDRVGRLIRNDVRAWVIYSREWLIEERVRYSRRRCASPSDIWKTHLWQKSANRRCASPSDIRETPVWHKSTNRRCANLSDIRETHRWQKSANSTPRVTYSKASEWLMQALTDTLKRHLCDGKSANPTPRVIYLRASEWHMWAPNDIFERHLCDRKHAKPTPRVTYSRTSQSDICEPEWQETCEWQETSSASDKSMRALPQEVLYSRASLKWHVQTWVTAKPASPTPQKTYLKSYLHADPCDLRSNLGKPDLSCEPNLTCEIAKPAVARSYLRDCKTCGSLILLASPIL